MKDSPQLKKLRREYDKLSNAPIKSKEDIRYLAKLQQRILKLCGHKVDRNTNLENI